MVPALGRVFVRAFLLNLDLIAALVLFVGLVVKRDQAGRLGKTTYFHLAAVISTAVRVVAASVRVELLKAFARARRDFWEHTRLFLLASLLVVGLAHGWAKRAALALSS